MATQLTADDARQSLTSHVESKGLEVYLKFGPQIGWDALQRLLAERAYVRYPCEIVFSAVPLMAGEFAHPVQKGDRPEEGFTMFVHPSFEADRDRVPLAVLYQLVAVNYGEFASAEDAETFGAASLGITRDEYYAELCAISEQLGGDPVAVEGEPEADFDSAVSTGCGGGGCGCH